MSDLQKITDQQMDAVGVCSAPDVLSGSTSENKAVFDKMVRQLIAPAYNAAVDAIDAINETETGIQAAEAERVSAEEERVSAEAERETAEEARVSAEEARVQAEQERAAAEEQREAAETGYVAQAEDAAQLSENWAQSSESWAVGGTGTRSGEDTNNAKYWSDEARKAAGGGVASFNGRTGVVLPEEGDYTREMLGIRMIRFGPQTSGDAFAITAEQMDQMLSDYPPLVFVTVEGLEIMLTRYDKTSDTAYYSNALYDQDRKRFVRLAAKGTSATVHSAEEGQIPMPSGDGDNGKYLKANSGGGFDLIPREFFKKAETLSDETAALYPDLPENPVPDDVFEKIPSMFQSQKILNSIVLNGDTSNVSFDVSEMDPKKKYVIRVSLKNEDLSGSPRIYFNFSDNSVIGASVHNTGISKDSGTLNQNVSYFDLTEEGEFLEFYVKVSSNKRRGSITVDAITKTALYFVSTSGVITHLNISISSIGTNLFSVDFYEL